jgi:hypothetical protein
MSYPDHAPYLKFVLTFSTHLHPGFTCGPFPLCLHTEILYEFLICSMNVMSHIKFTVSDLITFTISEENYKL